MVIIYTAVLGHKEGGPKKHIVVYSRKVGCTVKVGGINY